MLSAWGLQVRSILDLLSFIPTPVVLLVLSFLSFAMSRSNRSAMPTVRFLKKLKSREVERKKKNVDYKLEQLKDEIRAERLEKKLAKMGKSSSAIDSKLDTKKRPRDESDSDDDDSNKDEDGLLVVKQTHEWGAKTQPQPLPEVHINAATKSRHAKKIRIDGSSTGVNQKIVFNDDGEKEEEIMHVDHPSLATTTTDLASAKEDYLQKVKERLTKTKDIDRKEEKERIHEKHKKNRLKEKGDKPKVDNEGEMLVTLAGQSDDESESGVEEAIYESTEDDLSEVDDNSLDIDMKAQEELALQMLGS